MLNNKAYDIGANYPVSSDSLHVQVSETNWLGVWNIGPFSQETMMYSPLALWGWIGCEILIPFTSKQK